MNRENRKERIQQIRDLPEKLAQALDGLSEAQLDTPYRPGGWTIRQVVHHLADSHLNAFVRMKLILTEETPTLKSYDQDEWALLPDVMKTPLEDSLQILKGLHGRWMVLLEELDERGWERSGIHAERGLVTLDDLLTTYAGHGEKHIGHIRKLRTEKGW